MTRAALLVSFVVRAVGDIDPWCDAHGFAPEDQYRAVSTLLSSWSHEQRVKRLSESLTRSRGPSLGEVAAAYARADFAPEPRFEALRYSHLPTSKTVALLITGELRTLPTPVMQRFFDHVGRAVVSAGFQYRWFAAVDVCSKSKPCGTTHEASARDVRSLLETALGAAPEDVAVTGEPRCEKSCDGHAALARLRAMPLSAQSWAFDNHHRRDALEWPRDSAGDAQFDRVFSYSERGPVTWRGNRHTKVGSGDGLTLVSPGYWLFAYHALRYAGVLSE